MGSGQPSPLRDSLALIRVPGSKNVAGAALVITSNGFLVTIAANLQKKTEIVLPDGKLVTPIRVASDPVTGVTLLKVSADKLVPVQLSLDPDQLGEEVFAAGFDETKASYGQIAGHVTRSEAPASTPQASPGGIETDVGFMRGFNGGALSNLHGAVAGLIVSGEAGSGKNVISAIPMRYVTDWIARWRSATQDLASSSTSWREIDVPGIMSLRYPDGWSISAETGSGKTYQSEITPSDPDVPAQLSLSVRSTSFAGDPLDFARQQFGKQTNATIWGAVEYGQIPGVRLLVDQEGARVDVVYLFTGGYQIGLSLTAGYSTTDTGPQEQRVTAVFEAVLRSLEIDPALARN